MGTGCLDARVMGSGGCVSASSWLYLPTLVAKCSLQSQQITASCSLVCSVNSNAYVEIDKHTLWLNPTDVFNISSNTNWVII